MPKSNLKVVIVDIGGQPTVQPGAALLEKTGAGQGDILKIYNSLGEDAIFYMPNPAPFGAAAQTEIIGSKKSITRQLDNAAVAGTYTYQILTISGKKAVGNSDPMIIVEN